MKNLLSFPVDGYWQRWFGIAPSLRWYVWLPALLFVPSGHIKDNPWPRWRIRLGNLFPHVDPRHPRLSDLIRVPLQILWLILVRPSASRPPRLPFRERCSQAFRALCAVLVGFVPGPVRRTAAAAHDRIVRRLQVEGPELQQSSEFYAEHSIWDSGFVRYAAYALATVLALLGVTTPFPIAAQALFVALLWSIAMLIRRIPGPVATLLLVVLSLTASTRYLWWRVTYTLNWDESLDLSLGIVLLLAELYTWLILLLGYVQTAWPLRRAPTALPADPRLWPTVDVYIPTYNEPLKVVKPTVYAAIAMDWPADKLRVHILDDGRREAFREFAADIGVGYIIRPDGRHAKAGNLNHALTKTNGEFVAIFDCDHIPTRSFLQLTMGGFLRDQKLAMVQTPHHFFSPDPFERNLGTFRSVPNEGELFYGVIQDGNDLWNATLFCGSCAVIRRAPLEEIGGVAVETVTEDAHTALKLQRRGYNSAYINVAQAAGLATESLSAHIGQRIRWSRGMAQIFRIDNPFLGKGLNWAQRICYGNGMLHFLNGGPRLVFLTAPLAFLLVHSYVIYAPAISVVLYVLPHIIHANLANSRIQGNHRHSFWAEVYETVLAWYIVRPTTLALINPDKGRFNVTVKGGLVDKNYFDWTITMPHLTLVVLSIIGFAAGVARIVWGPGDEIQTVLINLIWTAYNIVVLGGAIAVSAEARQVRMSHRVRMRLPAILHLPNGKLIHCETVDFSEGGISLSVPHIDELARDTGITVSLWRGDEDFAFPARVTSQTPDQLRMRWMLSSQEQEIALVQCTFGRADAWASWAEGRQMDRPLSGLRQVMGFGIDGYRRLGEQGLPLISPMVRTAGRFWRYLEGLLPRAPLVDAS